MIKKLKVFPELSFWDYSLLVQVRMCHSHETQDLLSENTADSIEWKNSSGNRESAAQESYICGNISRKM